MGNKCSEETKRKIGKANSIALKKFHQDNPEFKKTMNQHFKGKPSWNKGKKHTKEHIENSRLAHIGFKHSKEAKKNMSGRIPNSKGKTYEELYGIEKAKLMKDKMEERCKGNIPPCLNWNKGMKMSKEHKKNHKLAMKKFCGENNPSKKPGVGKKISIAKTGKKFPIDKYPNMGVRKMRDKIKIPKKDSTIEIKIQDFLTLLKVEFVTHKYINLEYAYQCDIFIPSLNLVIETDGDYWHGNPKMYPINKLNERQIGQRKRDISRTKELLEKGYKVIRIWENEVRKITLEDFKEKIMGVKI